MKYLQLGSSFKITNRGYSHFDNSKQNVLKEIIEYDIARNGSFSARTNTTLQVINKTVAEIFREVESGKSIRDLVEEAEHNKKRLLKRNGSTRKYKLDDDFLEDFRKENLESVTIEANGRKVYGDNTYINSINEIRNSNEFNK